jgi:hypothetical protein
MSFSEVASAQSIQRLVNQPPDGAGIAFLLTDGTVLAQGNSESDWWKLTPDNMGSYVRGTWSQMASLPAGYVPDAFASAVLANGRLVIAGGEYNSGNFELTSLGAVYDPKRNTWTALKPPAGWTTIGDSPSVVLADGSFVVGQKLTRAMARLDPQTLTWTVLPSTGKHDFNSEEGWTLMPSGQILTADVKSAPHSEIYDPSSQAWTSAGSTLVDLHSPTDVTGCISYPGGCYFPPGEIGPQILRPDGTVFVTGGTPAGGTSGHTAVYHPATHSWTAGPDYPAGDDAGDTGAVLLPNGNVLAGGESGHLYEFNGTTLTRTLFGTGSPVLMLPSGQALLEGSFISVYNPNGTAQSDWAPVIGTVARNLTRGKTYMITGNRFNGMSQAAAFGDEFETATNYPLVRITNTATHHVYYARTHNHSTMGVATGDAVVNTRFDVPAGIETGAATVQVVANGVSSAGVGVTVN